MKKRFRFLQAAMAVTALLTSPVLMAQTWNGSTISTTTSGNATVSGSLGIGASPSSVYKLRISTGTTSAQGAYVFNSYTGSGSKYGFRSYLNSSGSGSKYGFHARILVGPGARYGVYSDAQGKGAWAGYFLGRGYFSENVGIGINNPVQPLHVKGFILNDGDNSGVLFGKNTGSNYGEFGIEFDNSTDPNPHTAGLNFFTPLQSENGLKNFLMFLNNQGNLGIGVKPSKIDNNYRLSVGGTIRAEEIVVETGWADFVFEEDYVLRPLNEVEAFIDNNGHLPEVPSACEVQENGAAVGTVQTLLLQKIEELTLYTIAQQKELEALTNRLNELEGN